MCISINYIFLGCHCTARVGWYTCFQARQAILSPSISTDDLIKGSNGIHDLCERYKSTVQEKRTPPDQCDKCLREMQIRAQHKMEQADAPDSGSETGSESYASTDDLAGEGSGTEDAKIELEMLLKGLSLGAARKDEVVARSVRPLNLSHAKDERKVEVVARSVQPLVSDTETSTDGFSIPPLRLGKLQPESSPSPLKIDKPKPVGLGLALGVSVGGAMGDPVKKLTIPVRSSSLAGLREARDAIGTGLGLHLGGSKSEGAEESESQSEGYETDDERWG